MFEMLLLLLLAFKVTSAFNQSHYINKDIQHPKCCRHEHHLGSVNSTLQCVDFQVFDVQVSSHYHKCTEKCVDVTISETHKKLFELDCSTNRTREIKDFVIYPKCCPIGSSYEPLEHKCVLDGNTRFLGVNGMFLKIGLGHCGSSMVVLDYTNFGTLKVDRKFGVTLGSGEYFPEGDYCIDETVENGGTVVRACQNKREICAKRYGKTGVLCIKKCCPDGQLYKSALCTPSFDNGIHFFGLSGLDNMENDTTFGIIHIESQKKVQAEVDDYIFKEDGSLAILRGDDEGYYDSLEAPYCVENVDVPGLQKGIWIFLYARVKETTYLGAYFLPLSCIFLLLTLLCYAVLMEMHNLYGKCVMVYCANLFALNCVLTYMTINTRFRSGTECLVLSFLMIFLSMAAFTWQNVICFDMWMAFGQIRALKLTRNTNWMRFLYYNLYAWGYPTFVTAFSYIAYRSDWSLRPMIDENMKCFYEKKPNTYDHMVYYCLPMTVLMLINVVLFCKTIIYCFRVKDDLNKLRDSASNDKSSRWKFFMADKEKLTILLKLFIVMGMTWLFELVSSMFNFKLNRVLRIIEEVWDDFNCLQGVLIFCIFILKRKILTSLKNKICRNVKDRRTSQTSTTMTTAYSVVRNKDNVNGRKISEVRTTLFGDSLNK